MPTHTAEQTEVKALSPLAISADEGQLSFKQFVNAVRNSGV